MRQASAVLLLVLALIVPGISSLISHASSPANTTQLFRLDSTGDLNLIRVKAKTMDYRGKKALQLVEDPSTDQEAHTVALLKSSNFTDGTIEVEVVGAVAPGADSGARGFAGIAFRSEPDASKFEYFYIRPTNGRANDQLRRNHATQYASHPDYPWERLRKENPGVYESYADMEPGVWTKLRIVVKGTRAELYVNDAAQPCLIVNDLKLGKTHGQIGLWIGPGTEAYFANLKITPA